MSRALRFQPLVDDGFAETLPELAIRYVISLSVLPTTEIGIANLEQLRVAANAVNRGPLPQEALDRVQEIQRSLVTNPA